MGMTGAVVRTRRTGRTERTVSKKGTNKWRRILIVVGVLLVLSVLGVVLWKACFDRVYRHCRAEAGTEITAADFMKKNYTGMIIADMGNPIDTRVPGVYQVYIQSGHFTYHSELEIVDTVAPTAETVDIVSIPGQVHTPEEFLEGITDETAVTVRFAAQPLFDTVRDSEVFILLTDAGGNVTELMAHMSVVPVLQEMTAEAGCGLPDPEVFSVAEGQEIRYATAEETETYLSANGLTDEHPFQDLVGEYTVYLETYGGVYPSHLKMIDTTPPEVVTQDLQIFLGDELTAEDFISLAADASPVSGSFVTEPDTSAEGDFTVEAVYTDAAGNQVQMPVSYNVKADTEAPMITGVQDMRVVIGDSVSYKRNVTVTDNHDAEVELVVDSSEVNLQELGSYNVVYSATDSAGSHRGGWFPAELQDDS